MSNLSFEITNTESGQRIRLKKTIHSYPDLLSKLTGLTLKNKPLHLSFTTLKSPDSLNTQLN